MSTLETLRPDLLRNVRRWSLVATVSLLATSCVSPEPMVAAASFADRPPTVATTSKDAEPACPVLVTIVDRRKSPDILGVVLGRAVKSPEDADAWLQSIFRGLRARGVAVTFESTNAPTALTAFVELQTAWLNDIRSSKTANVVVRVRTEHGGAPLATQDYRGSVSRINWASTDSELQGLIDSAFAKMLDGVAADLRSQCRAASAP